MRYSSWMEHASASSVRSAFKGNAGGGGAPVAVVVAMKRKYPLSTRTDLPLGQRIIPFSSSSNLVICRAALTSLLDIGRNVWTETLKHVQEGTLLPPPQPPNHGLQGGNPITTHLTEPLPLPFLKLLFVTRDDRHALVDIIQLFPMKRKFPVRIRNAKLMKSIVPNKGC
jgi:hypothetical protein